MLPPSRPRRRPRRPAALVVSGLATAALAWMGSAAGPLTVPAGAEAPSEVAAETVDDGVFVGRGRGGDVDESRLVAAVEDARFDGLRLVVVVPADPQPTAKAFARRVQEATEADGALVFPREGPLETYVVEDLAPSRIRATEAARQLSDPAEAVAAFAQEVTSVRDDSLPPIVGQLIRFLVIMALVVGAVVIIEVIVDRLRRWSRDRPKSSTPAS